MSAPGESSGGKGGAGKGKGKAADAPESGATFKRKRGMFYKDLQPMMYGFGDDPKPMPETVELVEDILVDYITDMLHKASEVAEHRARLTTEDLVFLVRKDARKYGRVKELLRMNEELKKARRAFETQDVEEE